MHKSKQDWLKVGIKTLAAAGTNGLTIERMAEALAVTKGSFYHHFRNMRHFEEHLVAHWVDHYTWTAGDVPTDPVESLALLDAMMEEAFALAAEPDVAVRAWAHQDEMVRAAVEQADAARQAFLVRVLSVVTGDKGQTARLMAEMLFAMLIGSNTALPPISSERVVEMYGEFKRLYGLDTISRQMPLRFPKR